MGNIAIVTHGGVGAPSKYNDGCLAAAEAGIATLKKRRSALAAAIAAAVVLENDGRFNAGKGAVLRLDGKTMERDASLMDSDGNFAAVTAVPDVPNPILLAREVLSTPHLILAGRGAAEFAKRRGLFHPMKPTERARERHRQVIGMLKERKTIKDIRRAWKTFDLKANWNFPDTDYEELFGHSDTIGAVAIDRDGRMAAANSTGGTSVMMFGRVGDSPIIGCGCYAGKKAAVATTGIGEEIIKKMLARTVYDWIAAGMSPQKACDKGVRLYPRSIPIGVTAVSPRGVGIAANRDMASACLTERQ